MICPQADSTSGSETASERQDCSRCSANEEETSRGLEHWEVVPINSHIVAQNKPHATATWRRRTSRNGYLGVVVLVYYSSGEPFRLSSTTMERDGA